MAPRHGDCPDCGVPLDGGLCPDCGTTYAEPVEEVDEE